MSDSNLAMHYLNKLLTQIPAYSSFDLHYVIQNSSLNEDDKSEAFSLISEMEDILKFEGCLNQNNPYGNLTMLLNEKGREIKNEGSFEKYKEMVAKRNKSTYIDKSVKVEGGFSGILATGDVNGNQELKVNNPEKDKPMPFYKQDWFRRLFFPLIVALIAFLTKICYDKYVSLDRIQNKELPPIDKSK